MREYTKCALNVVSMVTPRRIGFRSEKRLRGMLSHIEILEVSSLQTACRKVIISRCLRTRAYRK